MPTLFEYQRSNSFSGKNGSSTTETGSKLDLMMKSKLNLSSDDGFGSDANEDNYSSTSSGHHFKEPDQRSDDGAFGPMFKDRDHFNSLHNC